jgi:hypothetical protein
MQSGAVYAQEEQGIEVEFKEPLFQVGGNIAPGDEFYSWAKVENKENEQKKLGLELIDQSDCSENCLSEQLVLTVSKDGEELWNKSLDYLYDQPEGVFLSELPAKEEVKYDFKINFNKEAENKYQDLSVDFDLTIGIFGEESAGEELPDKSGSGEDGGDDAQNQDELLISNERIEEGSLSETSVVVAWETNKLSTSRVVYGTQSGVFNLDIPPKYGYQYTTPEFDTEDKTKFHEVEITGLSPATTYYYRVISHASPDTVSREYSFKTPEEEDEESDKDKEDEENETEAPIGGGDLFGQDFSNEESEDSSDEDAGLNESTGEREDKQTIVGGGSEEGVPTRGETSACEPMLSFWAWLLAVIVYLAGIIGNDCYRYKKKKGYRFKSNFALGVAGFVFWYYTDNCNECFWFIYIVGGSLILSYLFYHWLMFKGKEEIENSNRN